MRSIPTNTPKMKVQTRIRVLLNEGGCTNNIRGIRRIRDSGIREEGFLGGRISLCWGPFECYNYNSWCLILIRRDMTL